MCVRDEMERFSEQSTKFACISALFTVFIFIHKISDLIHYPSDWVWLVAAGAALSHFDEVNLLKCV